MPDTPMTDKERREKFLDWLQRLLILRRIDEGEHHEVDYAFDDAQCLARYFRSLHARLDQAHWDAISRDQTIENLRAENERYREALEFYACDDTYLPVMEGDGTPITGTVVVLHDGGHIARVALGYEEETWFNPRDAAYPDRFIAHAQSDIPALLKTIAELREAMEWYADHTIYEPAFANGGDNLDSHGMKSLAGIDSGNRARVALAALNGDSND
jgi:hypothetical protein